MREPRTATAAASSALPRTGTRSQHADGTPFFLVGDTWLAASTWRLPFKGGKPRPTTSRRPGISFEEAVAYRKRQGFNSISFIAAFPNWDADHHGATFANADGVYLRNAWEKFGFWAPDAAITTADGATTTAKDMADEHGHRPFAVLAERDGMADLDRLEPRLLPSLDRKMRHLADQGFVPLLETVRRDHGPSWKAYFDFDRSYGRYVQYLIARYGALQPDLQRHPPGLDPEGLQPDRGRVERGAHLALQDLRGAAASASRTLRSSTAPPTGGSGTATALPWLTMHTVGNRPRNNAIYALLEEIFGLEPPYPVANLEPYYTGWNHAINRPGGETPSADSDRDNYFARSMMYGSVLSGALAGHVHGTGAYDVTSTGEPAGWRPYIWEALRYASGGQMQHLSRFLLSEGKAYQHLQLASADLLPRRAPESSDDGLDGWAFMMRTADRSLALLYFEVKALRPRLVGFTPAARYRWAWFDPRSGRWTGTLDLTSAADGTLDVPPFPGGAATLDWAAKVTAFRRSRPRRG